MIKLSHNLIFSTLCAGAGTWSNIGGQNYCFDKVTTHFFIVLEQKTNALKNSRGDHPLAPLSPKVSATVLCNLGAESCSCFDLSFSR